VSEQDWALERAREIVFNQLPGDTDAIELLADALREARTITWPSKEDIDAHLTYMGAATEKDLPVNYDGGFRAGINWVMRRVEEKNV